MDFSDITMSGEEKVPPHYRQVEVKIQVHYSAILTPKEDSAPHYCWLGADHLAPHMVSSDTVGNSESPGLY